MIWVIIIIVLYFVPTITAYENKKKNKQSILVINTFLGWTFIGWIVALAMAVGKDSEKTVIMQQNEQVSATKELERLASLKEKGSITQEEFDSHKKKILG